MLQALLAFNFHWESRCSLTGFYWYVTHFFLLQLQYTLFIIILSVLIMMYCRGFLFWSYLFDVSCICMRGSFFCLEKLPFFDLIEDLVHAINLVLFFIIYGYNSRLFFSWCPTFFLCVPFLFCFFKVFVPYVPCLFCLDHLLYLWDLIFYFLFD